MNGILDLLADRLGGDQMTQLASAIGADPQQTQRALGAALPAILAGLNQNTNTTQGAEALARAVDRDHDGSLLDQIGGFLQAAAGAGAAPAGGGGLGGALSGLLGGNQKAADGGGILGHILGGQRQTVEQGVAQASGLNAQQVTRLLILVAPLVMAAIGKRKREAGLDSAGLSGLLGQEATRAQQAAPPDLLGALAGMLGGGSGGGSMQNALLEQAGRAALGKLFGR